MDPDKASDLHGPKSGNSSAMEVTTKAAGSSTDEDVPTSQHRKDLKGKVKKSSKEETQKVPKGKELRKSLKEETKKVPKGKESQSTWKVEAVNVTKAKESDDSQGNDVGELHPDPSEVAQALIIRRRRRRAMKVGDFKKFIMPFMKGGLHDFLLFLFAFSLRVNL